MEISQIKDMGTAVTRARGLLLDKVWGSDRETPRQSQSGFTGAGQSGLRRRGRALLCRRPARPPGHSWGWISGVTLTDNRTAQARVD